MLKGLDKKDINLDFYANELVKNKELINGFLDGLVSKDDSFRENCFNVLNLVSEKNPDFLYPHWDFFVSYLRSNNHFHKTAAIIILSNLVSVDKQKKFDNIFDEFYDNLKSEKTMMPMHLLKRTYMIVKSKPYLEDRITDILLNIDHIHTGKQIELVKSAVNESFSEFFNLSKNKEKIIRFVEKQIDSESLKTKKVAKDFLEKYLEK